MKMARVSMILLACASSAGASLLASAGKTAQPAPDSPLVKGDPYADNDDFDAPDFADDDREPTAEEEGTDEEPLQPQPMHAVAPVHKLQLHQAGVDHSPLPWEDEGNEVSSAAGPAQDDGFVPMARPANVQASPSQTPTYQPQASLRKLRRPAFQPAVQIPSVPKDDGSDPASTDFFKMMEEPTYVTAGAPDPTYPNNGATAPEDALDDGEGEADVDAMMMYYQGKVKSTQSQNKHLKAMLLKAATWGKAMKQKASELNAQQKLNAQLRAQIKSFQATSAQVQEQLQAEQQRESTLEDNVKSLQWVPDQRESAQRENSALKQQIQNATQAGADFQAQLAASKRDRDDADAAQQEALGKLKVERQEFQAKQKELALAKAAEAKEEAELAKASTSKAEVDHLKQVVEQRNQLLRKGLNQLVSERDQEQKLQDQAADQEKELQAEIDAAHSNRTALERLVAEQRAKEAELQKALAMTHRHVAEGAAEEKKEEKAARRARAELARVKAVDKKIQANTNLLKKQAVDERLAAQNATQNAKLDDAARLAARQEITKADAVIERLKQQHAATMAENAKLTRAVAKAKKESAQLKRDAESPSDDTPLEASSPATDGATTEPAVDEPAVAMEDAPDDLPTMDVVAP